MRGDVGYQRVSTRVDGVKIPSGWVHSQIAGIISCEEWGVGNLGQLAGIRVHSEYRDVVRESVGDERELSEELDRAGASGGWDRRTDFGQLSGVRVYRKDGNAVGVAIG